MAVYTQVADDELAAFLDAYDTGALVASSYAADPYCYRVRRITRYQ